MVVHLNVLGLGVEDGVLRKFDAAEVVAVDCRQFGHLQLQILEYPLEPYGFACRDNRPGYSTSVLDSAIVGSLLLLQAIAALPSENANPDVDLRSPMFPAQPASV
mgnify:CR=1 FL=1